MTSDSTELSLKQIAENIEKTNTILNNAFVAIVEELSEIKTAIVGLQE